MKISTFFNYRNYKYLYYIVKPFPKEVKRKRNDYSSFNNLNAIIDYIAVNNFTKIVVVASGPSSKKLKLEKDALYFTTNGALKLVETVPHIYVLNDSYYLVKYLKSFKSSIEWRSTIFWYTSTANKAKEYGISMLMKYLKTRSRGKKEFLITNIEEPYALNTIHEELVQFIKLNLNIDFYGVNSGFVTFAFAYVIAVISNKELQIYGLDMGEKGGGYFDRQILVGQSINGDENKKKVKEFLLKVYQSKIKIINHSNFLNYGNAY